MIMLPWRASGESSKMSLFIKVATRQGNRPSGRSPNTSRYSTIGKGGKHGSGTYPQLSMSDSSMQDRSQHEKYFVSTIDIRGQTVYLQKSSQLPVYTVEVHPRYYAYAKIRFLMHEKITLYRGDGRLFLNRLSEDPTLIQGRIFFYLDDNWSEEVPLREEIQIIFEKYPKAVVMVDDFRVPGDEEYRYVNWGEDKALSLEYLNPLNDRLKLAAFFPAKRAKFETGEKRGCVVLARSPNLIEKLGEVNTLVQYTHEYLACLSD